MSKPQTYERILIVRTDRLGDMILTLPMARAIRSANPNALIAFLVQPYAAPLARMCPDVDEVIHYDPNLSFIGKIRKFRSANADVAFFPRPKLELAVTAALARIHTRVGTAYRVYSALFTDKIRDHRKDAKLNEATYNVRMLGAIGITSEETPLPRLELPQEVIEKTQDTLKKLFGNAETRFVAIHVGSGGSSPNWGIDRYAAVANWAENIGYRILLTGTGNDLERIIEVREVIGEDAPLDILLNPSLLELAGVLKRAALVLASSTGPGHLAAALGTKTLGLFPLVTPLSANRWGFRGLHVSNISPIAAPKPTCPNCKQCICLEQISSEQVIHEAELQLLQ